MDPLTGDIRTVKLPAYVVYGVYTTLLTAVDNGEASVSVNKTKSHHPPDVYHHDQVTHQ